MSSHDLVVTREVMKSSGGGGMGAEARRSPHISVDSGFAGRQKEIPAGGRTLEFAEQASLASAIHPRTRPSRQRWLAGFVAVLAVLMVSGCTGGSGKPETTDPPRSTKDTTAPGVFDGKSTMSMIQRRGKLIVGMVPDEQPFSYQDSNTGSWSGFDTEIAKQIATGIFGTRIEGKIQWVTLDPRDREVALEQNRVDIALGRYAITVARKRFADFAGPYYVAHQQAVVTSEKENEIRALVELNGSKVCTVQNSTNYEALKQAIPGADASLVVKTVQECANAILNGQVTGLVADRVDLLPVTSGASDRIALLPEQFGEEPYGIGVRKGVGDLRQYINDLLDRDIADVYGDLYSRTVGDFVPAEPPPVDRY